jgi:hypothetical protein
MVLAVASCNTAVVDPEHVVEIDGERDDELDLVRTALGTKNVIPVKLTFNTDGVRVFLRISPGEHNQLRLDNTRHSKFSQPFKVRVRVCARAPDSCGCVCLLVRIDLTVFAFVRACVCVCARVCLCVYAGGLEPGRDRSPAADHWVRRGYRAAPRGGGRRQRREEGAVPGRAWGRGTLIPGGPDAASRRGNVRICGAAPTSCSRGSQH